LTDISQLNVNST